MTCGEERLAYAVPNQTAFLREGRDMETLTLVSSDRLQGEKLVENSVQEP